jgi:small subunit ribosomal protein S6
MPRQYEVVYIFDSTLEDAAIQDRLTRFHGLLGVSADDVQVNHWGRRQLAYPIGPRENGYYVVTRFAAESSTLPEYERALKLDDGVVRYLITLHEHEVGAPPMSEEEMAAAAARTSDEEED